MRKKSRLTFFFLIFMFISMVLFQSFISFPGNSFQNNSPIFDNLQVKSENETLRTYTNTGDFASFTPSGTYVTYDDTSYDYLYCYQQPAPFTANTAWATLDLADISTNIVNRACITIKSHVGGGQLGFTNMTIYMLYKDASKGLIYTKTGGVSTTTYTAETDLEPNKIIDKCIVECYTSNEFTGTVGGTFLLYDLQFHGYLPSIENITHEENIKQGENAYFSTDLNYIDSTLNQNITYFYIESSHATEEIMSTDWVGDNKYFDEISFPTLGAYAFMMTARNSWNQSNSIFHYFSVGLYPLSSYLSLFSSLDGFPLDSKDFKIYVGESEEVSLVNFRDYYGNWSQLYAGSLNASLIDNYIKIQANEDGLKTTFEGGIAYDTLRYNTLLFEVKVFNATRIVAIYNPDDHEKDYYIDFTADMAGYWYAVEIPFFLFNQYQNITNDWMLGLGFWIKNSTMEISNIRAATHYNKTYLQEAIIQLNMTQSELNDEVDSENYLNNSLLTFDSIEYSFNYTHNITGGYNCTGSSFENVEIDTNASITLKSIDNSSEIEAYLNTSSMTFDSLGYIYNATLNITGGYNCTGSSFENVEIDTNASITLNITGHYKGNQTFYNDITGNFPSGWIDADIGSSATTISADCFGRKKIAWLDDNGGTGHQAGMHRDMRGDEASSGVYEFAILFKSSGVNEVSQIFVCESDSGVLDTTEGIYFHFYDQWRFHDGAAFHLLTYLNGTAANRNVDTWNYVKIYYDCSGSYFNMWLSQGGAYYQLKDAVSANMAFKNTPENLDFLAFYTSYSATTDYYIDSGDTNDDFDYHNERLHELEDTNAHYISDLIDLNQTHEISNITIDLTIPANTTCNIYISDNATGLFTNWMNYSVYIGNYTRFLKYKVLLNNTNSSTIPTFYNISFILIQHVYNLSQTLNISYFSQSYQKILNSTNIMKIKSNYSGTFNISIFDFNDTAWENHQSFNTVYSNVTFFYANNSIYDPLNNNSNYFQILGESSDPFKIEISILDLLTFWNKTDYFEMNGYYISNVVNFNQSIDILNISIHSTIPPNTTLDVYIADNLTGSFMNWMNYTLYTRENIQFIKYKVLLNTTDEYNSSIFYNISFEYDIDVYNLSQIINISYFSCNYLAIWNATHVFNTKTNDSSGTYNFSIFKFNESEYYNHTFNNTSYDLLNFAFDNNTIFDPNNNLTNMYQLWGNSTHPFQISINIINCTAWYNKTLYSGNYNWTLLEDFENLYFYVWNNNSLLDANWRLFNTSASMTIGISYRTGWEGWDHEFNEGYGWTTFQILYESFENTSIYFRELFEIKVETYRLISPENRQNPNNLIFTQEERAVAILDYFNNTLYRQDHIYTSFIDVVLPITTITFHNYYSDAIIIEITRGLGVSIEVLVAPESSISIRIFSTSYLVHARNAELQTLLFTEFSPDSSSNYCFEFGERQDATDPGPDFFQNIMIFVILGLILFVIAWEIYSRIKARGEAKKTGKEIKKIVRIETRKQAKQEKEEEFKKVIKWRI